MKKIVIAIAALLVTEANAWTVIDLNQTPDKPPPLTPKPKCTPVKISPQEFAATSKKAFAIKTAHPEDINKTVVFVELYDLGQFFGVFAFSKTVIGCVNFFDELNGLER